MKSILTVGEIINKSDRTKLSDKIYQFMLSTLISFVFFLMPVFLSSFVLSEKITNFKHLMKLHGLSAFNYWFSIYLFYFVIFYFVLYA